MRPVCPKCKGYVKKMHHHWYCAACGTFIRDEDIERIKINFWED